MKMEKQYGEQGFKVLSYFVEAVILRSFFIKGGREKFGIRIVKLVLIKFDMNIFEIRIVKLEKQYGEQGFKVLSYFVEALIIRSFLIKGDREKFGIQIVKLENQYGEQILLC